MKVLFLYTVFLVVSWPAFARERPADFSDSCAVIRELMRPGRSVTFFHEPTVDVSNMKPMAPGLSAIAICRNCSEAQKKSVPFSYQAGVDAPHYDWARTPYRGYLNTADLNYTLTMKGLDNLKHELAERCGARSEEDSLHHMRVDFSGNERCINETIALTILKPWGLTSGALATLKERSEDQNYLTACNDMFNRKMLKVVNQGLEFLNLHPVWDDYLPNRVNASNGAKAGPTPASLRGVGPTNGTDAR